MWCWRAEIREIYKHVHINKCQHPFHTRWKMSFLRQHLIIVIYTMFDKMDKMPVVLHPKIIFSIFFREFANIMEDVRISLLSKENVRVEDLSIYWYAYTGIITTNPITHLSKITHLLGKNERDCLDFQNSLLSEGSWVCYGIFSFGIFSNENDKKFSRVTLHIDIFKVIYYII